MTTLLPQEPLALRQTNVSNPSVIHSRPSLQSFTASEDYYSLSGSSKSGDTIPADDRGLSTHTINRYTTPPSRYRTPLQSRDQLPSQSKDNLETQNASDSSDEVTKTPLRGHGTRRQSQGSQTEGATVEAGPSVPGAAVLREGGVRRKPVPSAVMEVPSSTNSQVFTEHVPARSSVAQDIGRDASPPTPGQDDTPYIRFALDQLTRDEEVRGSRHYRGYEEGDDTRDVLLPVGPVTAQQMENDEIQPHYDTPDRGLDQPATEQWPAPQRGFDEPVPKSEQRQLTQEPESQVRAPLSNLFIPVPDGSRYQPELSFLPGILCLPSMIAFVLLLLLYIALLLACAILSLTQNGLFDYGYFGDSNYFVCQYLPTLLGVVLFLWLVQIQVAVYRISPFIALSSASARSREQGVKLPLYPISFFRCFLGHSRAGQPIVAMFMFVSWLQIFTLPLLASAFNVYYYGAAGRGQWRWLATQGTTWTVIVLYLLLLAAVVTLMFWIRRQQTGVQWDPSSIADMIVLLERSNAVALHDDEELRHEPAQLGYWRTQRSGNEVFHTYGVTNKAARQYAVEGGRIREKPPAPPAEFRGRFVENDLELGREQRRSRERMLPRHTSSDDGEDSDLPGRALPWFLQPVLALLWPIIAMVLLIAFLVVSYIPSIGVLHGFLGNVPAPVSKLGFSATNFLYSFIPALLATICLLGWLDIDYAYRRLQPYAGLLRDEGELAERSLLARYTSAPPLIVSVSALVNGHLRVAFFSVITLIASLLPILAGGVFWAQFYVSSQDTRIAAQPTAYYALTFFVCLYGVAYLFIFPNRQLRNLDRTLPPSNRTTRFADIISLVRGSRILDDVAFHNPKSKTDLVTRLLSSPPGVTQSRPGKDYPPQPHPAFASSKVSVAADSVRGFRDARKNARDGGSAIGNFGIPRYYLGRYDGRDGRAYVGLDRIRS